MQHFYRKIFIPPWKVLKKRAFSRQGSLIVFSALNRAALLNSRAPLRGLQAMENTEDFVVVEEDAASEKKSEIDRLRVLVELFTKALDTLNQSNVLLKDELQSALSVTLQHVCPDRTSSTDDLIKLLDGNISSPEEVRANYVKRLCSRLVALNEEKLALLAENTGLRESLTAKEKEFSDQVADASLTTRNIEMVLAQLEDGDTNPPDIVSASTTIGDLCTSLNSIYDRLSKLQLKPATSSGAEALSECPSAVSETKPAPRTVVSVGVLTCDDQSTSPGTPKPTDLPPPPAYPTQADFERVDPQTPYVEPNDDLHEFGLSNAHQRSDTNYDDQVQSMSSLANRLLASGFPKIGAALRHAFQELVPPGRLEQERTEGAGRGTPQPSYSANQEEPWCPCCHQRFASRDDLETHLLSCLT
ncbi:hypothetical protein CRM22_009643 [Opisthorchis felineus]|uniref:Uncharacterized protein n=1 Tax=Opisthorchis felineus TaxID=147828 RepID=A0A4S2L5X6_OPIFE|nr:hypothetical protein CRM22_009643 [Opisthorchis felineus]